MKMELVTRRDDLAELAPRWDELAQTDSRDGFFRSSGWYRTWMKHIRPDAQPFVVVARDASNEIIGLAPLCRLSYRDHWAPLPSVCFGGREVVSGDYLDYAAAPHARETVLPAILDFLWEMQSHWGLMVVGEVTQNGDLHRAVESFAARNRLPVRLQEERICPCIELPASFEEYLGSFSTKRRHELRRQMRVLLEKSGATIEVHTETGQVVENLDNLIRLHSGRWNGANQSGNMGRPGFVAFLKQICMTPPAGAMPTLYLMKHEGEALAALLIFYSGQSALLYSMGWDSTSSLARQSPGIVLVAWSIEHAIHQGARYYDFLRGDEGYKSHLTKSYRKTVTLLVGRSLSAKLYLQALEMKDMLKDRFPAGWDRIAGTPGQQSKSPRLKSSATVALEGEAGPSN